MKINLKEKLTAVLAPALLFALLAQPGVSQASQAAQANQTDTQPVSYSGITFSYDKTLDNDLVASVVPMNLGTADDPYWATHPAHVKFEFKGFVTSGPLDRAIYVFPVENEYLQRAPKDIALLWTTRINDLKGLLKNKTTFPKTSWQPGANAETRPFLPVINAANLYVGKQAYLKFGSGEGVRYLTQLAQSPNPLIPEDVLYTFQGLTSDGKYYVAARFPVFLKTQMPQPIPTDDPSWVETYNQHVLTLIDQAKPGDFTVDLDRLDAMMTSITVDSSKVGLTPHTIPGMPTTGAGLPSETIVLIVLAGAAAIGLAGLGLTTQRAYKSE